MGDWLVGKVTGHVEWLPEYPDIGRAVPEFEDGSIREWIHPPFRVVDLRRKTSCPVVRV